MSEIVVEPLTREAFAPFGQVIAADDTAHHYPINAGMTERYHDLARGVLTPLEAPADFLVVDRGGDGNNLEEYLLDPPLTVVTNV